MGLKPTLKDMITLVDTASAIGGGAETLQSVAMTMGQIHTKGKVSAEELMQLAERGIPAYEILAEKLNLTKKEVADIGRAGVSSNVALKALMEGMEERYGGAAQKYMATWRGMIESSKSLWLEFQRAVMKSGPFEAMKKGLKGFLDYLATNEGQMDLTTWARETAVAVMQGFQLMVRSANVFLTILKNTQSLFAGFMSQVLKFRLANSNLMEMLPDAFKKNNQDYYNSIKGQKEELQKSIKYWDDFGINAQVALMKAEDGFTKVGNALDEFKKKTNNVALFSGGTTLPGNNPGIGGDGSGSVTRANKGVEIKVDLALNDFFKDLDSMEERIRENGAVLQQHTNDIALSANDLNNSIDTSFGNAFQGIVKGLATGATSIKDTASNLLSSLADSFLDYAMSIAKSQLLMSSGGKSGDSWIGALFKGIASWGAGGGVGGSVGPTPGTGLGGYASGGISTGSSGGHMELLHGTEAVVPLSGGRGIPVDLQGSDGGGETINNITIQAMDSKSFTEFLRSNPGALVSTLTDQANRGNTGLKGAIQKAGR
jgi:tape measure domain-containing protein